MRKGEVGRKEEIEKIRKVQFKGQRCILLHITGKRKV
jgi:hypothetical protein